MDRTFGGLHAGPEYYTVSPDVSERYLGPPFHVPIPDLKSRMKALERRLRELEEKVYGAAGFPPPRG